MLSAGSVIAKFKSDITDLKKGVADAKSTVSGMKDGFTSLKGSVGSIMMSIGSAITDTIQKAVNQSKLLLAGIGAGLLFAGKRALDVAGDLQQASLAYETLLGSSQKAESALEQIKKDAAKTPFDLRELIRANQMLISTGEGVDGSRKAVLSLGNAIVATGGGNDEFNRMIGNLQQIRNIGKATEMDMRQFGFAGINIYRLLAESTGEPIEKLKEMDITYDMITGALQKASESGGLFANALENQGGAWNLLKSNLMDVINIVLSSILMDTGLFSALNSGLQRLVDYLTTNKDAIVGFFNNIGMAIRGFVEAIRTDDIGTLTTALQALGIDNEVLIDFLGKLAGVLREVGNWIVENKETVIEFLKGFAIGLTGLLVVSAIATALGLLLNPIVLVAGAIALLYTAYQTNFMGIRDIVNQAVVFIMAILQTLQAFWTEHGHAIMLIVQGVFQFIWGVIQVVMGLIIGVITTALAVLRGDWAGAWEAIKAMTSNVWAGIKNIIDGAVKAIIGAIQGLAQGVGRWLEEAWNKAKEYASKIKDTLSQISPFHKSSPSLVEYVEMGTDKITDYYRALANTINGFDFKSGVMDFAGDMAVSGDPLSQGTPAVVNQYITNNVRDSADAQLINERLAFLYRNQT